MISYEKLVEMKRENESLSDVIERLMVKRNTDIRKYFGVLNDNNVLDGIEDC